MGRCRACESPGATDQIASEPGSPGTPRQGWPRGCENTCCAVPLTPGFPDAFCGAKNDGP